MVNDVAFEISLQYILILPPTLHICPPHLLDSLPEYGDVFFECVSRPGVEQLIEELADVPPNFFRLWRDVLADDGKKAGAVRVLDDETDADDPAGRHYL